MGAAKERERGARKKERGVGSWQLLHRAVRLWWQRERERKRGRQRERKQETFPRDLAVGALRRVLVGVERGGKRARALAHAREKPELYKDNTYIMEWLRLVGS